MFGRLGVWRLGSRLGSGGAAAGLEYGGSSGGPWLRPFTEGNGVGTIRGVNSYGYSGVKKEYASKFNTITGATFTVAKSATSNTIVN